MHKFKKFFGQYSSESTAHYHCHVCHTEYLPGQTECTNSANAKQDTLIVINPKKAITRVLKSKCFKLNALLMFIFSALFCAGNCEDLIISQESKDTILADIHDGKRRKDLSHVVSYLTDGISPFKSSGLLYGPY